MARRRKPRSGSSGQPIRDIPGGSFGEGQQLRDLQGAAPLEGPEPAAPAPGGGGGTAPRGAPVFGASAFRPTERPGEAITSGIPFGPGDSGQNQILPTDSVDAFLRALYGAFPSDAILRLLKE